MVKFGASNLKTNWQRGSKIIYIYKNARFKMSDVRFWFLILVALITCRPYCEGAVASESLHLKEEQTHTQHTKSANTSPRKQEYAC